MQPRDIILLSFHQIERRSRRADPVTANENLADYATRLDALDADYQRDLDVIRQCMERVS